MRWTAIPMVVGGLALAGCGAQTRESSFSDVQKTVSERTDQRIHWNQGLAEDEEAARAVHAMIASELTSDAAVQIALLNNRNLQATYEDLGIAQADLVRAGLLHNPMLSATTKFHPGGGVKLEFSIVEDFLDVFFIPMRKRLAETTFEAAKLRVAGAVIDLASETRVAFYRMQLATQTLEMRRTVVEATALSSDLAARIHAAGNSTMSDLVQERALYEQAKLDLAQGELQLVEAREHLNRLMGVWGSDTQWTAYARLPEIPSDEMDVTGLEKRAIERSIDLGITRTEIALGAQRLGIARPFGAVSSADLGVAAEKELDGQWAFGPTVAVPLPMFNGGGPAVSAARAELRASQDRYAAQAVDVRSLVRVARERLLAARARAEYMRRVLIPLRQLAVEQLQLQYNGMLASPFKLIQAKQQEIEAGGMYIESLGAYWIERANLQRLLDGRMSSDGAQTPMMMGSMGAEPAERGH